MKILIKRDCYNYYVIIQFLVLHCTGVTIGINKINNIKVNLKLNLNYVVIMQLLVYKSIMSIISNDRINDDEQQILYLNRLLV